MDTKKIYFLRHGQTALNKTWVHQYPETLLSEKGQEQAKSIAEQLKNTQIDIIICSPFMRTKQTADAVALITGAPVEQSALFVELRRSRELWGKSWLSIKSIWIMGLSYLFAGRVNWHYSDEENLEEFRTRTRRALEFIADRPEENILVVTHRGFMAGLVERLKRDGMETVRQYRRALWKNLSIGNCCYYTAEWTQKGENGKTLDGTWTIEKGTTCPS